LLSYGSLHLVLDRRADAHLSVAVTRLGDGAPCPRPSSTASSCAVIENVSAASPISPKIMRLTDCFYAALRPLEIAFPSIDRHCSTAGPVPSLRPRHFPRHDRRSRGRHEMESSCSRDEMRKALRSYAVAVAADNLNPLDSKGNYRATSNNTKLVHWPLMGGLLHLVNMVQREGAWTGCGPAQVPPRCTKCNSPPINGQCTNHRTAV